MSKLRNIFKNLFLSLIVAWNVNGFAQVDKLNRAQDLYQVAKKPDLALPVIDSVVQHPDTKKDFIAWTLRAFIYHDVYKRTDKTKLYSALRDTIISSVKMSNSLKPDAEYKKNNDNLMRVMAGTYFNLAKNLLQDSLNAKRSQFAYSKSKELTLIIKPDSNFKARDVEYYNTVGGIFSDLFNKDNNNAKNQEIAKVALLKVLELQADNASANMNLGLMYYNHAANLVKSLDYGADISQIDVIQESIIKLAKQAEPLIYNVYKSNNKNPKAVEGLYLIYRMLNENAKMEQFKLKCKELKIAVE